MSIVESPAISVPYFRPSISEAEIEHVVSCLRSGWLTSGPRTKQFEEEFGKAVHAKHAVAVNSCTAALHLAVESLNLKPGQAVLVPTMTFAATAEIVRYQGAIPILVDCDPVHLNMDLVDAERKLDQLRNSQLPFDEEVDAVGIIPVHLGGVMVDMNSVNAFAKKHRLWVVEDAAHAFPAAMRESESSPWVQCGEDTSAITCYSFYTNKTITTGEGGMAVTANPELAARMRTMSLHGLSNDAWNRFSGSGSWDYRIIAPGYKYNLTDVAASLGRLQLQRGEEFRAARESIARQYDDRLSVVTSLELPAWPENRLHAWHLYPLKLRLDQLKISRNDFIFELRKAGVGCSVHWRPLHLHPYYEENFKWKAEDFPVATRQWERLISLPLFPGMSEAEIDHVVKSVAAICAAHAV